jgi:hypothetical protein
MRSENLKVQEEDLEMEQLKVAGIESENQTAEGRTANSMFNAIIRFADSRVDIDRALSQLIATCKSEQARLQQVQHLILVGLTQLASKKRCKSQRS